jgi:hypothetical protein
MMLSVKKSVNCEGEYRIYYGITRLPRMGGTVRSLRTFVQVLRRPKRPRASAGAVCNFG